jgi:hypothetical protein
VLDEASAILTMGRFWQAIIEEEGAVEQSGKWLRTRARLQVNSRIFCSTLFATTGRSRDERVRLYIILIRPREEVCFDRKANGAAERCQMESCGIVTRLETSRSAGIRAVEMLAFVVHENNSMNAGCRNRGVELRLSFLGGLVRARYCKVRDPEVELECWQSWQLRCKDCTVTRATAMRFR